MFKLYLLVTISALYGSTYAAKTSHKEIVSFINDDKLLVCNGKDAKWFLPNGTRLIHSSDKFQIDNASSDESTLTVRQINSFNVGVYTCLTTETRERFDLKLYFPLSISHNHRVHNIKENENAILKCKTSGVPKVEKIVWYFEGKELIPDVDYKPLNDGIILENVTPENAGKYTCVAYQELETLKNIQESFQELIVEYGPTQDDSEPKELPAKIGETVTLDCKANGEPKPSFTWLVSGYNTFSNIENRDYTSSLKVKINTENDFATYTCLAENEHGRANQTFVVRERTQEEEESRLSNASKAAGFTLFTAVAFVVSTLLMGL